MRTTHRMLLRIWHDPKCDFQKVTIGYINRGAASNFSTIDGKEVLHLDSRGIIIKRKTKDSEEVFIPYHRIWWIQYDGQTIWSHVHTS